MHTDVPSGAPQRLDAFLRAWLPAALGESVSASAVRRLIVAGAIEVDGWATRRPAAEVQPGQRVSARVDPARLAARRAHDAEVRPLTADDILFEDEALLAVAKPAGWPMHPTADPSRPDLVTLVQAWLGAPDAYVGVHQRLDHGTSGVVVLAKQREANASLARQFESGAVRKTYLALVLRAPGPLPPRWEDNRPLVSTGRGTSARMTVAPSGDGEPAVTAFLVRDRLPGAVLVEARPATGRKHQIRAHLAAAGLPIVGDGRYGGPSHIRGRVVPRPMLHAWRLQLAHPVSAAPLRLECEPPEDFLLCLEALREPPRSRR